MLGLPSEYAIDKSIQVSTFMTSDLLPKEKKRFKESVESIKLAYQIAGESIPSLINDQYDCQALLFFEVQLNKLKDASFICDIIQKLVKPLCVIRCYDVKGMQTYSIAHKRLNLQDRSQVVIEDSYLTAISSSQLTDDMVTLMNDYAAFEKIRNKANKMTLYIELMTKAYIISHLLVWSRSKEMLASKAWYNVSDAHLIFDCYKRIIQLQKDKKAATTISDQSKYNSELKNIFNQLSKFITQ
ncbi:DUF4391 domain-containing protein [Paenibacillus urinalis]|uniref:DUF4391 domain-containing protein n=1 Tax=Paenibacillus urinalis TaxID=521520 RepID=UPI002367E0B7|nr:DUF4391 domain-containing protein [Paenibacillus urinalis]WDH95756.1 DUF4391 domain-containing protein [Paenibacillus urinalis]